MSLTKLASLKVEDLQGTNIKYGQGFGDKLFINNGVYFNENNFIKHDLQSQLFKFGDTFDKYVKIMVEQTHLNTEPTLDDHSTTKKYVDSLNDTTTATFIQNLDNIDIDLNAKILAEADRAKDSENSIIQDNATFIQQLKDKDDSLLLAINSEITRAKNGEKINADSIIAEMTRAANAENGIKANISENKQLFEKADLTLQQSISAEKLRAEQAETNLLAFSNAEKERAMNEEASITTKLNEEIVRSIASELNISKDISDEASRAAAQEVINRGLIDDEHDRATTEESKIKTAIEQEILNRKSAILKEVGDRDVAISKAVSQLIGDAPDALDTLKELSDALKDESDSLVSLLAKLSSLEIKLEASINANRALITQETSRAETAETIIQTSVNTEIERAVGKEAAIQNLLDSEIARAKQVEGQIKQSVIDENTRAQNAEKNIIVDLGNETKRAQAAEANVGDLLSNETERAKNAEMSNSDSIANEVDRAKQNELDLTNNLEAYKSFAQSEVTRLQTLTETYALKFTELAAQAQAETATIIAGLMTKDGELSKLIETETSRSTAFNLKNESNLNIEIERAQNNEKINYDLISSEKQRAIAKELELSGLIVDEKDRALSEESAIKKTVSDNLKNSNLTFEEVKSSIALEKSRSSQGRLANFQLIELETANRINSVKQEEVNRQNAIKAAMDGLIGNAPGMLDTLSEIADSIQNNPNMGNVLTDMIDVTNAKITNLENTTLPLSGGTVNGDVTINGVIASSINANHFTLGDHWRIVPSGEGDKTLEFQYRDSVDDEYSVNLPVSIIPFLNQ